MATKSDKGARGRPKRSTVYSSTTDERGAPFEQALGEWLVEKGIPFKNEDTLRSGAAWGARHSSKEAKEARSNLAVPDFFFPGMVYINGVHVSWIDAKNYMIPSCGARHDTIQHQVNRWNQQYGQGAIMARHGGSSGLMGAKITQTCTGKDGSESCSYLRTLVEPSPVHGAIVLDWNQRNSEHVLIKASNPNDCTMEESQLQINTTSLVPPGTCMCMCAQSNRLDNAGAVHVGRQSLDTCQATIIQWPLEQSIMFPVDLECALMKQDIGTIDAMSHRLESFCKFDNLLKQQSNYRSFSMMMLRMIFGKNDVDANLLVGISSLFEDAETNEMKVQNLAQMKSSLRSMLQEDEWGHKEDDISLKIMCIYESLQKKEDAFRELQDCNTNIDQENARLGISQLRNTFFIATGDAELCRSIWAAFGETRVPLSIYLMRKYSPGLGLMIKKII